MPVRFDDYSHEVKSRLEQNIKSALMAIGQKGVELTLGQMESGYGKPIRQTGDLMRDVQYEVERGGENTVDIGNSLEYAPFVHDGTYKIAGRHYLRDAIMSGRGAIQNIAEQYLKQGF